jgi:hypothetical protein
MSMDDLTRSALLRGVAAFAVVLTVGSVAVFAAGRLDRSETSASPSPTAAATSAPPTPGTQTPEAWLAWVPGGLPDRFGSEITSIPVIDDTTTATADVAWLTSSINSRGNLVDMPSDPYVIPIDTTGVEAGFASFLQPPERRLVADLEPDQGVLSESEAKFRRLDVGSTMTFSTGKEVSIVGTLPDVLMGGYELLVGRNTGQRIGVTHERYVLFHVKPYSHITSEQLAKRLVPYLPINVPYPNVEVRAPGETTYLRANDRAAPPIVLKQRFGEFDAYPDPGSAKKIVIDQTWINGHIASEPLPVLGTVQCNDAALDLLRRAMTQLKKAGRADDVNGVGACYDEVLDPTDPDGPFTASPFGAAIQLNPGTNPPGTPPTQPPALVSAMARWGFGWGGRDAYAQGALFRYRARSIARD